MEKRKMQMTSPGYDLVLSLRGHSAVKNDIFDAAADEIERLRNKVETLLAYARHERDLGAEQVTRLCLDEILGLRAAVEDAQKLIDKDLVGPRDATPELDWIHTNWIGF